VFGVVLLASTARAQPPAPPTAQQRRAAKAHFDQGRAFYEAGAYADAVRAYQAAYAIVRLPDLLFNIGQAFRLAGDKPRAIDAYQRFLEKVPDGALSEEARNHVAALRLRIQVEEAEAGRQKAAAEAEAARRQAAEAEAARRRAEADAAARLRAQTDDEAHRRRLAQESVTAQREREAGADQDLRRRLEEARGRGSGWRIGGAVTVALGLAFVGLGVATPYIAAGQSIDDLSSFNSDRSQPWSENLDRSVRDLHGSQSRVVYVTAAGGAMVLGGVVMYYLGVRSRSKAEAAVRRGASARPAVGPSSAGLAVGGRF
jgi:tetratricopeptide (TPR) repeat protein